MTVDNADVGLNYKTGEIANATLRVDEALQQCNEWVQDGGSECEVFFPRGMYFYGFGGIRVPPRTTLKGEAAELVSILFYEQDNGTTLFNPNAGGAPGCKSHKYGGQGPWNSFCSNGYIFNGGESLALQDLTIYVTKYHEEVIHITNSVSFVMSGVRIRALPFFALSVIEAAPEELGGFHNRYAPYSFKDIGTVILIENSTNFRIVNSDVYGLGHVIQCNNVSGGIIAHNRLRGGQAPGLVNAYSMIVEHNYMESTWEGSSFYFKYGYHTYHAFNTEKHVYVGDREGFTYDNPGRSMMAMIITDAGGTSISLSAPFGSDNWSGFSDVGNGTIDSVDGMQHVLILLNGTGAPQYRFILSMASPGVFEIDSPFAQHTAVAGTYVGVNVVKAQNIHLANFHQDTGHFQFFNGAIDTVIAENVGSRMGGFFTWGQVHAPSSFFQNGFVMSASYWMAFVDNEIMEGNSVKNYVGGAAFKSSSTSSTRPPTPNASMWRYQFNGGSIGCITQTFGSPFPTIPSTAFLIFRRNRIHSNGAIMIGSTHETYDDNPHALGSNFVCEHNTVERSPLCVVVNSRFTQVTTRGNICTPGLLQDS